MHVGAVTVISVRAVWLCACDPMVRSTRLGTCGDGAMRGGAVVCYGWKTPSLPWGTVVRQVPRRRPLVWAWRPCISHTKVEARRGAEGRRRRRRSARSRCVAARREGGRLNGRAGC